MDKDLEFLLNSEFTEGYRNDELRSFLSKFKYYFRLVWSQSQTRKVEFENTIQKLEKENIELKSKIICSGEEISRLKSQISDIKKRSLVDRILNRY